MAGSPHNAQMIIDNSDALFITLLDRVAEQDDAALKVLYRQRAPKLYGWPCA
jgi:hypothetical protein